MVSQSEYFIDFIVILVSVFGSVRCVSSYATTRTQTEWFAVVRGGSLHTRLMWFYMYFMLNNFNLFACTLNIYLLLFFSHTLSLFLCIVYFFCLHWILWLLLIIINYYWPRLRVCISLIIGAVASAANYALSVLSACPNAPPYAPPCCCCCCWGRGWPLGG